MDRNRLSRVSVGSSVGGFGKPSRIPGLQNRVSGVAGGRDSFIPQATGGQNRLSNDHRLSGLTGGIKPLGGYGGGYGMGAGSSAKPYGANGGGGGGASNMTSRFSIHRPSTVPTSLKKKLFSGVMTPQGKPRASTAPGSAAGTDTTSKNRRNSLIGDRKHLKDSRPLSDGHWQHEACAKLITFLNDQGYPHKIPDKLSRSPQQGDLVKIYEFLFGYFCNKVKITRLNLDTEVPKLLKLYGYPFQVTKSVFCASTTKQALGHLFGTFDWLVNSLNYMLKYDCEKAFQLNAGDLLKIALDKYHQAVTDEDVDERLESLAVKQYGSQDEYMKLLNELEALQKDTQELEEQIDEENKLPHNAELYTQEVEQQQEYLNQLEALMTGRNEQMAEIVSDIQQLETAVQELKDKLLSIDEEVKKQEFGADEADMARKRQKQLDDEIAEELRKTEEMKKEIRIERLRLSELDDEIRKLYSEMQSYLIATRDGFGSHASKDCLKKLMDLVKTDDWDEVLEPKNVSDSVSRLASLVNELKLGFKEQRSLLADSPLINKETRLQEIDRVIKDLEQQSSTVQSLIERLKADSEAIRKEHDAEIADLSSEIELNKKLLAEMDEKLECSERDKKERIKTLRKQVAELSKKLEKCKMDILERAKSRRNANLLQIEVIKDRMREAMTIERERIRRINAIYDENDKFWEHVKRNTRPRHQQQNQ